MLAVRRPSPISSFQGPHEPQQLGLGNDVAIRELVRLTMEDEGVQQRCIRVNPGDGDEVLGEVGP